MPRITFQKETVKEFQRQLHEAYALGDVRLVRRIAVLLAIARGEGLSQVEEHQQTTYGTTNSRAKSWHDTRPPGTETTN